MITVRCPSCKRVHHAPESVLGRRVQCKDCGTAFLAERAASTGPEQAEQGLQNDPIDVLVAGAKATPEPAWDAPGAAQVVSSATGPKRPFGLVWVVFYWILGGLACLVGGYVLSMMGGALGGAIGKAGDMLDLDSRDLRELSRAGGLAMALLELIGLLLFHYGLLLIVACYGLWTFRRWGLVLARGLAIASVVLNVIVLIVALVTRAGIVVGMAGLVISAGILVYLYGSANLRDRLQRYLGSGRSRGGEWGRYE